MNTFTRLYTASLTSYTTPASSEEAQRARQVAAAQCALVPPRWPRLWATVHTDLHGCFAGRRDGLVAWQTVGAGAANLIVARHMERAMRTEFATLRREIWALGVVATHPLVTFSQAIAAHPQTPLIAQWLATWGGVAGNPQLVTEAIER